MAFAVDDIVLLTPVDKMHPTTRTSNGYGRVIDTNVNGNPKLYRLAIGNASGFLYLFEEADLSAVPVGTPLGGRVTASLPTKKGR